MIMLVLLEETIFFPSKLRHDLFQQLIKKLVINAARMLEREFSNFQHPLSLAWSGFIVLVHEIEAGIPEEVLPA